jgi:hypothetical protein
MMATGADHTIVGVMTGGTAGGTTGGITTGGTAGGVTGGTAGGVTGETGTVGSDGSAGDDLLVVELPTQPISDRDRAKIRTRRLMCFSSEERIRSVYISVK